MKVLLAILPVVAASIAIPALAQEAAGDWRGELEAAPGTSFPIVVHIRRGPDGVLSGTLDSPAQGANGLPLAEVTAGAGKLAFKVPVVGGEFAAAWDAAAKAWKGDWAQGGRSLPLMLTLAPPPPPLPANWKPPANAALEKLIAERIVGRTGQGLVVGVLEPGGRRVVARGPVTGSAFGGDTVFEIGSMSKVFTALLLADMVNRGKVKLDDPAEIYLPAGAKMPARAGRKITLADLATHTSGLPRLADNMPASDPADPYSDYTEALLLDFLASHELGRDIGAKWEYSNLGAGLLGYLLGRAARTDYETLLRRRITGPLGLADTVITLPPAQQARFAPGFDPFMRPAKPWRLAVLAGAGAIRSSANDMLMFAAAVLDHKSPIAAAVKTSLTVRRPTDNPRIEQALGWQVMRHPRGELLTHNGGTGGYRAALAIQPALGTATVVLANSAVEPSAPDLGLHVLAGAPLRPTVAVPPAPPPIAPRTAVTLPGSELDRVVGRYAMAPGVELTVTRRGPGLVAQLTGQPAAPIFAEAPLRFFYRVVAAQLRFTADASGAVTGVELDQNGRTISAKRIVP